MVDPKRSDGSEDKGGGEGAREGGRAAKSGGEAAKSGNEGARTSAARDDVILGRAVRDLREAKALSEEALAGRLGVPSTYVGRLERGERGASRRSLRKILGVLEATHADLAAAIARHEQAAPDS